MKRKTTPLERMKNAARRRLRAIRRCEADDSLRNDRELEKADTALFVAAYRWAKQEKSRAAKRKEG